MAHGGQEDSKREASKSELRTKIVRKPLRDPPRALSDPSGKGPRATKTPRATPRGLQNELRTKIAQDPLPGPSQTLPGSYFGTN